MRGAGVWEGDGDGSGEGVGVGVCANTLNGIFDTAKLAAPTAGRNFTKARLPTVVLRFAVLAFL